MCRSEAESVWPLGGESKKEKLIYGVYSFLLMTNSYVPQNITRNGGCGFGLRNFSGLSGFAFPHSKCTGMVIDVYHTSEPAEPPYTNCTTPNQTFPSRERLVRHFGPNG